MVIANSDYGRQNYSTMSRIWFHFWWSLELQCQGSEEGIHFEHKVKTTACIRMWTILLFWACIVIGYRWNFFFVM